MRVIFLFYLCLHYWNLSYAMERYSPFAVQTSEMYGFPNEELGYDLGVSGCYAGKIGNEIIMAGGCNFLTKRALLEGDKRYYKGIYKATVVKDSILVWSSIGHLPVEAAYGVSVSFEDKVIIVGGANAKGAISSVYSISLSKIGTLILDTLPSLPCTLDNMSGTKVKNKLYIFGGNRNGIPSSAVYSLDLSSSKNEFRWKEEVSFPGLPRVQLVCTVQREKVYLWGGFVPVQKANDAVVFADGYFCDVNDMKYGALIAPSEKEKIITLTGGQALPFKERFILCIGGVNKEIFKNAIQQSFTSDEYMKYLSKPIEWYKFNKQILLYDIYGMCWWQLGQSALLARAGATLIKYDQNSFLCIGGELKPGVRTSRICKITILN